jgi:prenylcysteine oxidase/farnesylcysteine lyase
VASLTRQILQKFSRIPSLLNDASVVLESPTAVWEEIGLDPFVVASFDQVLDAINVPAQVAPWRQRILGHGSLREEFLSAMNLVNYNQDTHQINGLVGLGSFAASFGGLFSVAGGNVRLIASAYRQANQLRRHACVSIGGEEAEEEGAASPTNPSYHREPLIRQVSRRVTTVIARPARGEEEAFEPTFELFAEEESLGVFDIVVVAAPLQQARIEFFVQSVFDPSVLQPMPLGRNSTVNPVRESTSAEAAADSELLPDSSSLQPCPECDYPPFLPVGLDPASTRPYTQVVTTLVSNATLALLPPGSRPRSIMMTTRGKATLFNITAITQLLHHKNDPSCHGCDEGVSLYKIFSDERLPDTALAELFGPYYVLEHVKAWPRLYGGATPDYQGQSTSEHFLLFDGGGNLGKARVGGGAIYYPIAMEQSTLACMELSAIGAKATAKLIAHRLGLLAHARDAGGDKSLDEL